MSASVIGTLLAERLGFDPVTIGSTAVEALVRQCMADAGFSDEREYAHWVGRDDDAWESLVDRAVVLETRFFRDAAPFDLAAEIAVSHVQRRPGQVFRVLSCPCSTGEEPYSIAMSLLERGVPSAAFAIEAVDVSRSALEAAREGRFRASSLKGMDRSTCDRHFVRTGTASVQIGPVARAQVRFRQSNLLAPDFLKHETPYDLVFCRNLLIYLHASAKARAVAQLRRLMAPGATLVVGHAEAAFVHQHGFSPTGPRGAFALVQTEARVPPRPPRSSGGHDALSSRSAVYPSATARPVDSTPGTGTMLEPPDCVDALQRAQRLADAGQIDEAFQVCAEYLDRVPDSADGHCLIALLHDAAGRFELGLRSLRRTLYLDPSHREALLRLALRQEASGDHLGAARLRERAARTPHVPAVGLIT
jgi:chemotaxis protein methyltransferase WspC